VTLDSPELVELRDGSSVLVRLVAPEDKTTLTDAFERLSAESRYRRFLSAKPRLTDAELRYLTEVDHHDHEAVVAFDPDTGQGVGVARFVRDPDRPRAAEAAVTVPDDWHGRGVGTELLHVLAERARTEGIDRFTALLLAENRDMLDLLERLGPIRHLDREAGTIEIEVELEPPGAGVRLEQLLRDVARGVVDVTSRLRGV